MADQRPRSRSSVADEFGHPWPWMVEEVLLAEFERKNGNVRQLANAFDCHPTTLEKWIARYRIRERATVEEGR